MGKGKQDCGRHHYRSCCGCIECSSDCCVRFDCPDCRSKCCGRSSCHSSECGCCLCRALLVAAVVILLVSFTIFVVWLVLRPSKPDFNLTDATVYQLNLSLSDNLLSTVMQATVASRNPNGRIGVLYDRLLVFATYQDQQITLDSNVPPFYQGDGDVNVWSPYLVGSAVPVAPYLCETLRQDESAGILMLQVRINGKLRWKVGTWTSSHYNLDVTCPALFAFRNTSAGVPALQFLRMSPCRATV